MNRFREFVREPAILIDLTETIVIAFVAFGIGLTGDQQTYIVAAVVALLGLLKAFLTQPFAVAAVTDFGRAVLMLLMAFGVGLTSDQSAVIVTLLGTVTTLVLRSQVTPSYDPVTAYAGAGAGPVGGAHHRGEVGAGEGRVLLLVVGGCLIAFVLFVVARQVL